jgi:hypothetical protein
VLPDGRVVISQAYGPLRLLSDSLSRLSTLPGPADLACGGLCLLRGGGFLASDSRRHVVLAFADPPRSGAPPCAPPWRVLAGRDGLPGAANGSAGRCQFNRPAGLCALVDGTVLVADAGNNAIRAITFRRNGAPPGGAGEGAGGEAADGQRLAALSAIAGDSRGVPHESLANGSSDALQAPPTNGSSDEGSPLRDRCPQHAGGAVPSPEAPRALRPAAKTPANLQNGSNGSSGAAATAPGSSPPGALGSGTMLRRLQREGLAPVSPPAGTPALHGDVAWQRQPRTSPRLLLPDPPASPPRSPALPQQPRDTPPGRELLGGSGASRGGGAGQPPAALMVAPIFAGNKSSGAEGRGASPIGDIEPIYPVNLGTISQRAHELQHAPAAPDAPAGAPAGRSPLLVALPQAEPAAHARLPSPAYPGSSPTPTRARPRRGTGAPGSAQRATEERAAAAAAAAEADGGDGRGAWADEREDGGGALGWGVQEASLSLDHTSPPRDHSQGSGAQQPSRSASATAESAARLAARARAALASPAPAPPALPDSPGGAASRGQEIPEAGLSEEQEEIPEAGLSEERPATQSAYARASDALDAGRGVESRLSGLSPARGSPPPPPQRAAAGGEVGGGAEGRGDWELMALLDNVEDALAGGFIFLAQVPPSPPRRPPSRGPPRIAPEARGAAAAGRGG